VTDLSGRVVPSDVAISWRSLNPEVVSVQPYPEDPAKAQARGGDIFGTTTLVATLKFEQENCSGRELSATISLQNFPTNTSGLRILVVDQSSDALIGGATVMVNGVTATTHSEADKGVVWFADVEPPFDIHIFHQDYHYLSLMHVNSHDILAPLRRFYGINRSAGVAATLDYGDIPPIRRGDASFGLAGLAYTRSLLDLHIGSLFSQPILTSMDFRGPFHSELPLPSNVSLHSEDQGSSDAHTDLLASGDADSSIVWALGGYMLSSDLLELVTGRLDDNWTDIGAFLLTALAFSNSYYFGLQTDIELSPLPMVPDNGSNLDTPLNYGDINGNGQETDYVPDYDGFTQLDEPIALTQSLNQQVTIRSGTLPLFGGNRMDGVFAIVGKCLDGRQFIPLGVGTRYVEGNGTSDKPSVGTGGELKLSFAPLNGGDLRNDEYVVIAYAMPFEQVFTRDETRQSVSAILSHSEVSPRMVEMGDFLPFVPWAFVFESERRVQFIPVSGANLHRIGFSSDGRDWEILVGNKDESGEMQEITLPKPPGHDPFGLELAVTAATFWLTDAQLDENDQPMVSTTLDDLVEFNAKPLSWLDRYVKRFSLYHFDQRK
jgi:hypothetical protein